MKKYMITGGSGFIGSHLVLRLLRDGFGVVNIDIHKPFFELNLQDEINNYFFTGQYEFHQLDMADSQVERILAGCDGVYHLGGVLGTAETMDSIPDTAETNVVKSLRFMEYIRRTGKKAVYITIGNDWENPYTITKTAAARFALMYNREFGTKITVIRGLNVYGPRQKWFPVNKYFPRFVVNALKGDKIPVFGDGEQLVDVVYVGDVVDAFVRAMDTDFGKEQYTQILDAGTGHATTVNEVVNMVLKAVDPQMDYENMVEFKPMRPGEPIRSKTLGDIAKINEILGFAPKTDLIEGIRDSVEWYRNHYKELEEYANGF